jgi:hypothetical protein
MSHPSCDFLHILVVLHVQVLLYMTTAYDGTGEVIPTDYGQFNEKPVLLKL